MWSLKVMFISAAKTTAKQPRGRNRTRNMEPDNLMYKSDAKRFFG